MAQNFIDCDREQAFLLPPSLREWLAEDHLAWFVIEVVEKLDLAAFYGAYREDGHGRAAYDPAMMVGLVLYAYATGERSSRGIERHCRQDIAYRVITANQVPDHATIARIHSVTSRHSVTCSLGARVVREGRDGEVGDRGDRWHEGPREREPGCEC